MEAENSTTNQEKITTRSHSRRGVSNRRSDLPIDREKRDPLEILAEQYAKEVQEGKDPSIEDYIRQMPENESEIRQLFPAVLLMEKMKECGPRQRIRSGSTPKTPPPKLTGKKLGEFILLRQIGKGGMGVVYQAVQQGLDRRVALKVMNQDSITTPTQLKRFRREVRLAANLHHNHIVPVFSVGQDHGVHYYSMQYIDGVSLDRWIAGDSVLPDATSGLLHPSDFQSFEGRIGSSSNSKRQSKSKETRVEDTVSQSSEIVHSRYDDGLAPTAVDTNVSKLKNPSSKKSADRAKVANLSAETRSDTSFVEGEESSSQDTEFIVPPPLFSEPSHERFQFAAKIGLQVAKALSYAHSRGILHRDIKPHNLLLDKKRNVWVTDFGLAKLHGENDITQSTNIVGTLRYMAPEQIQGKSTGLSDLYSLGLTLYELVAGRPAFENHGSSTILEQRLKQQDVPSIKKIVGNIPKDLETIISKLTRHDPADRYQSGQAVVEDLQRYLEGRSILARRTTAVERTWKWTKRNPALACALVTIFLLLAGIAGYTQYQKKKVMGLLEESREARKESNINLGLATEAFDQILETYSQQLVTNSISLPGSETAFIKTAAPFTAADAERLNQLLSFYESFAVSNQRQVGLVKKIAIAKGRFGDVYLQLGQWESAEETYQDAIDWITDHETTIDQLPDDQQTEIKVLYASILNQLGRVNLWRGNPIQAKKLHEDATKEFQTLSGQNLSSDLKPTIRHGLANSQLLAASVEISKNVHFIQVRRRSRDAINKRIITGRRNRNTIQWRNQQRAIRRAQNIRRRMLQLAERNSKIDLDASRELLKKALTGLKSLHKDFPDKPEYQIGLAQCLLHLTTVEEIPTSRRKKEPKQKDPKRAGTKQKEPNRTGPKPKGPKRKYFLKSLQLLENLCDRHPDEPEYQYEYASVLSQSRRRVDGPQARENLLKAVEIAKDLRSKYPTNFQFQLLAASSLAELGEMEGMRRNWSNAESLLISAIEDLKKVSDELVDESALAIPIAKIEIRLAQLWMHPTFYSVHSNSDQNVESLLNQSIARLKVGTKDGESADPFRSNLIADCFGQLRLFYQRNGKPRKANYAKIQEATWRTDLDPSLIEQFQNWGSETDQTQ